MAMELPRRSKQHEIGDLGAAILQRRLPKEWVYRDLEGRSDYGIDGEIEVFEAGHPVGLSCLVQVRSHQAVKWTGQGDYLQPVEATTRNYWRLRSSPVVVIVCDVAADAAWWTFADQAEVSTGVRVSGANGLPSSASTLRQGISDRLSIAGPRAVLAAIPLFEGNWLQVRECTDRDAFMGVEDNELVLLLMRVIYAQIPYLGLPPESLIPWAVWSEKAQLLNSTDYEMYWGVFDEIIDYLRPIIFETLQAAADRFAVEDASTGDVTLINWAQRWLGTNVTFGYSSTFRGDLHFWKEFDALLAARGVRAASAVRAFEFQQSRRR